MINFPQLYFCVVLVDPAIKDYMLGQFIDHSPYLPYLNVYIPTEPKTMAASLLIGGSKAQEITVIGEKGVAGANLSNYIVDKTISRYRNIIPVLKVVEPFTPNENLKMKYVI